MGSMSAYTGHQKIQSAMEHPKPFEKRFHPKAQSAMEYLMTYGWAILVIAVVLGVLYSLGVFNPLNFAPKAQPGSCQVFRPNGPGTNYDANLAGTCNDALPEYVGVFGANSVLYVPNSHLLFSNPNGVTVSVWVYLPAYFSGAYRGIVGFTDCCSSGAYDMIMEWNQPNHMGFEAVSSAGVRYYENPNIGATLGIWENYVGVYNGSAGTVTLYINGARYTLSGVPSNIMTGTNQEMMIGGGNGNQEFPGSIANLQIYNTSLSSNAISILYYEGIGGVPVKIQNLVAWYPLNGNANDYSGNNNNGVPTAVSYTGSWQSGYTAP